MITTHSRKNIVSNAETASEWEADDSHAMGGTAAPPMAPTPTNRAGVSAMGRMGSNRMVVTSSIHRDGTGAGASSQKWDTPRRPGGLAGAGATPLGATGRRNRWDVS